MSKKSKRAKSKARFKNIDKQDLTEQIKTNSTPLVAQIITIPKTSSQGVLIKEVQYKYIKPELIRISVIAGIFFLILIVASIIVK